MRILMHIGMLALGITSQIGWAGKTVLQKKAATPAKKQGAVATSSDQAATQVVKNFADQVIGIIQSGGTSAQFKQAFAQSCHVSAMARSVLPKALYKRMQAQQKQEFVNLFLEDITADYFGLMKKSYRNDQLTITNTKQRGKMVAVMTELTSADGRSVSVTFNVVGQKIVGVIFENLSLLDEKKTKYQRLFRNSGNDGVKFLDFLKKSAQEKAAGA